MDKEYYYYYLEKTHLYEKYKKQNPLSLLIKLK
jgi:hypothetical protein